MPRPLQIISDHVSVSNGVDYDTPVFWNCEEGDPNGNGWYSDYIWVCSINYESTTNGGGIVIDSGATATVCGRSRLGKLVSIPEKAPTGSRTFRFGDGGEFVSEGLLTLTFQSRALLNGVWMAYPIHIATDIPHSSIPLLLSRRSLSCMKAEICFGRNILSCLNPEKSL